MSIALIDTPRPVSSWNIPNRCSPSSRLNDSLPLSHSVNNNWIFYNHIHAKARLIDGEIVTQHEISITADNWVNVTLRTVTDWTTNMCSWLFCIIASHRFVSVYNLDVNSVQWISTVQYHCLDWFVTPCTSMNRILRQKKKRVCVTPTLMFVSEIIDKSNNQLRYDYLGNICHFRRHWLRCALLFSVFGTKPVKNVPKPYQNNNIIYTTEIPLLPGLPTQLPPPQIWTIWVRNAWDFCPLFTSLIYVIIEPKIAAFTISHNCRLWGWQVWLLRYIIIILDFTKKLGNTFEATTCKIAFIQVLTFGLPFYRNSHQTQVDHRVWWGSRSRLGYRSLTDIMVKHARLRAVQCF